MPERSVAAAEEKLRVRARLTVLPDLREIAPAVDEAVRAAVGPHQPSLCPGVDELRLALTEALNNVVEHSGHPPEQMIEVCVGDHEGLLHVCIEDAGKPLPTSLLDESEPPAEPEIGTPQGLEALQEGGWGWMLIRSTTAGLTYRRQAGRNRLCLAFSPETLKPAVGNVVAFPKPGCAG
ncbi:MAG: ATP-binding protein [Pseudomonadota bacterium]